MKRFRIALMTALAFAFYTNCLSQEFEFYASAEGGLPLSNSLKEFHDGLADQIQLDNVETTGNFGYNYGFTVGFRINKNASMFFTNRVAGSKSSVADFSGFIRLTNELKGYTFGLEYEITLQQFKQGKLNVGFKGMVTPSTLTLATASEIGNQITSESLDFRSLDFGGAVGLNYEYDMNFIVLRAHLDINAFYGGKLSLKGDDSGGFLTDNNGNKVTTGWTGFTGGIGFLVPLAK